jgi:hypothetical protein
MVPRLWTCIEQPASLTLLSLPLRPVLVTSLVFAGLLALLTNRIALARLIFRAAATFGLSLVMCVAAFSMAALALAQTHTDPTLVLRWAPWAWAILGPLTTAIVIRLVGTRRAHWRSLFLRDAAAGSSRKFLLMPIAAAALFFSILVGARPLVSDERAWLSAPYRLFEFLVPDQIVAIASDECLAARVFEYGDSEPFVGQPATWKLEARGDLAVDAVVTLLNEAREHWPPKPHEITKSGVFWALSFVHKRGAENRARSWADIPWQRDLDRVNEGRPFSLLYGSGVAP